MRRRSIAFVVILLIVCSFLPIMATGTGESSATPQKTAGEVKYKETLTLAPNLGFLSMDVQGSYSTQSKSIYKMVFDTLVAYDPDLKQIVPYLAKSWTQKSDLVWEFKLRDDVVFHDGTKFTADDVKFTYDRGLTQSASKGKLNSVASIDVINAYTVRLTLSVPDGDILYKLTELNLCILSKHAFETLPVEQAYKVGTGAFKYVEWVSGDYLSLTRNDNYWGELPKTKNFIIDDISDASTRLIALQTGEVDLCVDPSYVDLHYVQEDPKLKLIPAKGASMRFLGINTAVAPFNDIRVRQAIAYAFNRKDVIAMVYEGHAEAATNVMMPTMGMFYTPYDPYPYDIQKAKDLLAKAGFPNGFSTDIYTGSGSAQKAVGAVFQAQMALIGIDVTVKSLEQATFNATVAPGKPYTIMVNGWAGYHIGPDNALRNHFTPGGANNHFSIDDPWITKQLDTALALQDASKRAQIYLDVQKYITDLAAFIPVAVEVYNIAMRADMEGFRNPVTVYQDYRYLYVEE